MKHRTTGQANSNRIELTQTAPGQFLLEGELNFFNVNRALSKADTLFHRLPEIRVDLRGVTRSDSAGLALLIEWTRSAGRANQKILFDNLPQQMLSIAGISGLDGILPMGSGSAHPSSGNGSNT